MVCEKEVVFVPKSGQIIVKTDRVISLYKTDTPTAKSDMSKWEKSELEKGIDWNYSAEYSWWNEDKIDRKVSV